MASALYAADVKVTLAGDQEVPPVATSAAGSGTITVGDDKSVSGSVTTTVALATAPVSTAGNTNGRGCSMRGVRTSGRKTEPAVTRTKRLRDILPLLMVVVLSAMVVVTCYLAATAGSGLNCASSEYCDHPQGYAPGRD